MGTAGTEPACVWALGTRHTAHGSASAGQRLQGPSCPPVSGLLDCTCTCSGSVSCSGWLCPGFTLGCAPAAALGRQHRPVSGRHLELKEELGARGGVQGQGIALGLVEGGGGQGRTLPAPAPAPAYTEYAHGPRPGPRARQGWCMGEDPAGSTEVLSISSPCLLICIYIFFFCCVYIYTASSVSSRWLVGWLACTPSVSGGDLQNT